MSEKRARRKLTAIFSADVKGYSRLMADDEEATVRTITAYREVMTGLIADYGGRAVDAKGDNVLAEFSSVVDAVRCAVEVQKELKGRNSDLPEHRRMEFRIGINLGDVIEEEGTIYGDGVNVAARLEGLAEGGGICISGTAFDQIKNRIPVGYAYQGKQSVKNIPDPVRVYQVLFEPEAAGKVIGEREPRPLKRRWAAVAAVALMAVVAVGLVWNFHLRPDTEPASKEKMAYPLPDKPSIAVLPFVNLTGDPQQEFLSDGLTEDMITALSRVPNLFVIARNSTFTYKKKPVKVRQVAEDLGVRYVLEGSLQRSGDKIRVTAQLIDALKGYHVMSERLERTMKEIFALQDDITKSIIVAVQVKLTDGIAARVAAKGTSNIEAYLMLLEARELLLRFTKDDNALARRKAEDVLALDPDYANAYALLSTVYVMDMVYGVSPGNSMQKAFNSAKRAVSLDDSNASAHLNLGFVYSWRKEHDKGIAENERAADLEPGSATMWFSLGRALDYACRHEEAIELFKKAIRMNPLSNTALYFHLGNAYFNVGKYEEAISAHKKALELSPTNFAAHRGLAACYAQVSRNEEAAFHAREVLKYSPKFCVAEYIKRSPWKEAALTERWASALRKAGLPENPPLPLPDKPSIAVLPFTNMSGDPGQEYFSDGMTEEIITGLARVPRLFVIARNSTFKYKGKPVMVQRVGQELGVRYVLEGSIQRSEGRVRITAQLVDAVSGKHLWAEKYDRDLKDIFALQDEITLRVVTALQVKLTEGEQALIVSKGTDDFEAYEKFLRGRENVLHFDREGTLVARKLAEEAVALDPGYPRGYRLLGTTHMMDVWFGSSLDPRNSLMKAAELYQKVTALDPSDAVALSLLGLTHTMMRLHEKGIAEAEKAVALNPNAADAHAFFGFVLHLSGRHKEAIGEIKKAIRLNPFPPNNYFAYLGHACLHGGMYEESVAAYKRTLHLQPDNLFAHIRLAAAYGLLGREDSAHAEAAEVLRINPKFSTDRFVKTVAFKDQADTEFLVKALGKAGLK